MCTYLQLLAESDTFNEEEYKSSSEELNCLRTDHVKVGNFTGAIANMETAVSVLFPRSIPRNNPHTQFYTFDDLYET